MNWILGIFGYLMMISQLILIYFDIGFDQTELSDPHIIYRTIPAIYQTDPSPQDQIRIFNISKNPTYHRPSFLSPKVFHTVF